MIGCLGLTIKQPQQHLKRSALSLTMCFRTSAVVFILLPCKREKKNAAKVLSQLNHQTLSDVLCLEMECLSLADIVVPENSFTSSRTK